MERCGIVVVEDSGDPSGTSRAGTVAALQQVANQPIAHHVVDVLEGAGIDDIVVVSSIESGDEVRQCLAGRRPQSRVKLRYVEQPAPVDFLSGLHLAAPVVGAAPCVAHVANGLLEEPLGSFLQQVGTDSPDVVLIMHQSPAPQERLSASAKAMLHLAELKPDRAAVGVAGVALFGLGALRRVTSQEWAARDEPDWGAIAEQIGADGGTLHVRLASAWRSYKGSPFELLELNRIALDRLDSDERRRDDRGNRVEGRVRIHDAASIRSSVIVGPVVIGAEAQIADAYIGPYTSVGAYARVEGTEIEGSIVAAGATVMHVGCRLAGSVIGQNARVFRDFSVPRAIRLRVAAGAEVALC
jgi:glucose-1-phosphate thymidylyltransferase